MQHFKRLGDTSVEVDHFNPNKKNDPVQDYLNLLPASRHCNNAKRNFWPKSEIEARAGRRILNPRTEHDYDHQIVECIESGELIGLTPAAKFHIIKLDLNAEHFCQERRDRTNHLKILTSGPIRLKVANETAVPLIRTFRESVKNLIPPIQVATPLQIREAIQNDLLPLLVRRLRIK